MAFSPQRRGQNVFSSVDNRSVPFNPLHSAWEAKSFTDGDIVLHFCILDLLAEGEALVSGCSPRKSETNRPLSAARCRGGMLLSDAPLRSAPRTGEPRRGLFAGRSFICP